MFSHRSYLYLAILSLGLASPLTAQAEPQAELSPHWAIALHGGAGIIERKDLSPEMESHYRHDLAEALDLGQKVLAKGGSALDAVEVVIKYLEDDPLFNAGRGAVFTAEGKNELDAAIMDGASLKAGAVAGVTRTRHPIALARTVMEKSEHVFLAREGADQFSKEMGLEQVEPGFFFTQRRFDQLQAWKKTHNLAQIDPTHLFGTVGVVALDRSGHLAAGTSTGGMTGKRWGRIGDTPIIGAGTYANTHCAVSATGSGEYFIRQTAAHQVCMRLQYNHQTLQSAADDTIEAIGDIGGDGGLISLDDQGHIAFAMNSSGMYRAKVTDQSPAEVKIFKSE